MVEALADDIDEVQNVSVGVDISGETTVVLTSSCRSRHPEVQTIATSLTRREQIQLVDLRTFAAPGSAGAAISEVQTITATGSSGDTFDLTWLGQTATVAFGDAGAVLATALRPGPPIRQSRRLHRFALRRRQ